MILRDPKCLINHGNIALQGLHYGYRATELRSAQSAIVNADEEMAGLFTMKP